MNPKHHLKPIPNKRVQFEVTPASVGWRYLHFQVLTLRAGDTFAHETNGNEVALTTLKGRARVNAAGQNFDLARRDVFQEMAHVLYVPPHQTLTLYAESDFECALGGAPAEGKYPTRLFLPNEMRRELRGGGAATRQVNHLLAYPLPAERLILYDAYVPGGMWAGYPPHCHDGYAGSPYLEETYYYRITPENGFAIHRNYCCDSDFDELFTVRDGELVLVTQGFHPVATAPGSNVYFLNYLAGELYDDARATPPYDDPAYAWLKTNWQGNALALPMFKETQEI
ncbi:MAG: 5-deoxy-glucuronate isomerase [Chloroflexota bacterium]|nr:MAG: 5-deoxy-glucuronate isomerase [Chloroflexota bacterium]